MRYAYRYFSNQSIIAKEDESFESKYNPTDKTMAASHQNTEQYKKVFYRFVLVLIGTQLNLYSKIYQLLLESVPDCRNAISFEFILLVLQQSFGSGSICISLLVH